MTDAIQTLNHRHEAIAEWLIANPDKSQRECAEFFNYTESWLSQVINSDLFQALYVKLCEERKVVAIHSIGNKMNHATSLALDKTIERLKANPTDNFLQTARDNLLEKLGYSGKGNLHLHKHEDQHLHLTKEQFAEIQERARVHHAGK